MTTAIYPGSFDPLTNGHLDIVERCVRLFDRVVIAILTNSQKTPLFSADERKAIVREVLTPQFPRVEIEIEVFHGLLVDYAQRKNAQVIVRGIRAVTDYEYELQMALMNRRLRPDIETVFMMANEAYSFISSRLVKEVFGLGGSITGLVPPSVEARMQRRLSKTKLKGA